MLLDYIMGSGSSASRASLTATDIVNECSKQVSISSLNILVTGATSGIGLESARVLALAGAQVYAMGRSETKLQEVLQSISKQLEQSTNGGSIKPALCDLNSLQSIKTFAEKFVSSRTPMNILLLNAGLLNYNFEQTVDGLEQVIGVNHIGHAYLTKLLMPTLIANAPSRVVIVSSKIHDGPPFDYAQFERMSTVDSKASKGWGMMRSYQQSKLANLLFARGLASKYKENKIYAYSLHPGIIATNLASRMPLSGVISRIIKNKTVEQGAATNVYCCIAPNLESETGRYFDNSTVTNMADKWSEDDVQKFWQWTEKFIEERTSKLSN